MRASARSMGAVETLARALTSSTRSDRFAIFSASGAIASVVRCSADSIRYDSRRMLSSSISVVRAGG